MQRMQGNPQLPPSAILFTPVYGFRQQHGVFAPKERVSLPGGSYQARINGRGGPNATDHDISITSCTASAARDANVVSDGGQEQQHLTGHSPHDIPSNRDERSAPHRGEPLSSTASWSIRCEPKSTAGTFVRPANFSGLADSAGSASSTPSLLRQKTLSEVRDRDQGSLISGSSGAGGDPGERRRAEKAQRKEAKKREKDMRAKSAGAAFVERLAARMEEKLEEKLSAMERRQAAMGEKLGEKLSAMERRQAAMERQLAKMAEQLEFLVGDRSR